MAIFYWLLVASVHLSHEVLGALPCTPSMGKFVDLSYVYDETTPSWITLNPIRMKVLSNGTEKGYWYKVEEISGATHSGTHLDAPCHFAQGRWCVSDIPLERLVAPAVVVNLTGDVGNDQDFLMTEEHLQRWELKHGQIPDGSIVLLYTGWSRFFSDRDRYFGTSERDPGLVRDWHFPSVAPRAAEWLVANRNIYGLGLDTPSVDSLASGESVPKTHQILEEKNIFGLENVANTLAELPATGAILYVSPMKLKDSSGAPCRVLAFVPSPESLSGAGTSLSTATGIIVSTLIFALVPQAAH